MTPRIRRTLRAGDLDRIVAHHAKVYRAEYGVDERFVEHVAATVEHAAARGFPTSREAIAIVEVDGVHAGSMALTDEGDEEAALRWVVLDATLRGRGLGRKLVGDMLAKARETGYVRVWLETFSELTAAAHLYRDHGFRVVSEDAGPRWGRDLITFQRYEVELDPTDEKERLGRLVSRGS
jgi:ribosomal protein S18 acetylase RimI-like enzyme